jgi:hypothetical protein
MTDQNQAAVQSPTSRAVTIDDVRTVLDGADPNQTNASKVRALLGGRGSFETIQKHLATLRQELAIALAPPVDAGAIPAMPADVGNMLWAAAWSAAQVQTLRRTEVLAGERDAALLKLETMSQDVTGLIETVDAQAAEIDQIKASHSDELEAVKLTAQDATTKWAELAIELDRTKTEDAAELERTRSALAKVQADAAHTAELADAARAMMREELARLTDQVGELKAHLYKRADLAVDSAPLAPAV